ncbi:hypothetical protein BD309DRAFT_989574 [Dichomitus squalens]|uniref:Uncharacterized protein n=1 Tax=Dichomitus squalens TaxID=114155 RepID=A0A4Q9PIZ5_9APHY|nr:hypothetical protein BD309DRAFT_989574 [Dichomitus squalens]TBU54043.1 hypothetical protein BD310DRAFT_859171 [Dichomitus squalens]
MSSSTILQLNQLPTDVLLHIFVYLEIADVVRLRKTCKALEAVTRDRSVWHEALSTRFMHSGIPVPGVQLRDDISSLSSTELERLAIRASRYWANWTSPQPQCYTRLDIRPTPRPWSSSPSHRTLAIEFVTRRSCLYLLTLTLCTVSSGRDNRRFAFECWDLQQGQALGHANRIAELLVSGLLSYSVDPTPNSKHLLAVTSRDADGTYLTTTYTIDFTTPNTDPWFRRTSQFLSYRRILGFMGSRLVVTDDDNKVRVIDIDAGVVVVTLNVPLIHADPTLRLPEQQCLEYEVFDDFIITFCKQWIYLYHVPTLSSSMFSGSTQEDGVASSPTLEPIAQYKWRWRIDSISINARRPRPSASSPPPPPAIDLLVRFDTWYPWPVNILHHFVLPPSASFARAAFAPAAPPTFPYLPPAADGPLMAHAIPSPLRLFTPSDMVLAPRGTALWLDASTDATTPSQAGDHGQRIASRVLARASPSSSSPSSLLGSRRTGTGAPGAQDDQVSPGTEVDLALVRVMALEAESGALAEDQDVSVLHVQETHELWNRIAVDEEEGMVAVGHVDGRVSVFVYAPPE